mgnify:CR=1 FL=1
MSKGRTRGPNRPSGKFVRHDWMWLWMAGSKLKDEILFKSTNGAPGATPNAKVQFFSHDNAIKATAQNMERAAGTIEEPEYDEPYDFDAEIDAARDYLNEEVKDACSVAAENLEQAVERCGTKQGNKGFSAMQSAVETVNVLKSI